MRTIAVLACLIATMACGRRTDVDDATLRSADAGASNWLTYGRTYSEQRFSPLHQIDERSVPRLGLSVVARSGHAAGIGGDAPRQGRHAVWHERLEPRLCRRRADRSHAVDVRSACPE